MLWIIMYIMYIKILKTQKKYQGHDLCDLIGSSDCSRTLLTYLLHVAKN